MPFVPILLLFSVRLRDVKVSNAVTVRKALYAVMVVVHHACESICSLWAIVFYYYYFLFIWFST